MLVTRKRSTKVICRKTPLELYSASGCSPQFNTTSSTAQGGGGSFKNRKPIGEVRLVVVNQGWQSEATDGAKGD